MTLPYNAYFNSAANQAYDYYNQHIALLPKLPNGDWDLSGGAFHNTELDAFRHAYAAAVAQYKYPDVAIEHIGYLHELLGSDARYANYNNAFPQSGNEFNMDLWNNRGGFEVYNDLEGTLTEANYQNAIGDAVKQKLDGGELITNPNDPNNPTFDLNDIPLVDEAFVDFINDLRNLPNEAAELLGDVADFFVSLGMDIHDFFADAYGPPNEVHPLADPIGGGSRADFGLGMSSPIALDLDGDGLEYVPRANSNVFFDIDNDHFAEHVQWVKGDDGFLVRDLNGNGKIDSVAEMFGDNGGTSAYNKLATLDSNSGGTLTSADAAWSSLRVWQDVNENGQVDAGELKTLASINITSINISHTNDTVLGGQPIAGQSTFVMNGATRVAADVLLDTDQMNSWYVGDGTPGSTDIDLDTLFLPLSRGYGTLPSLHFAMSNDATLKGLVADFATLTTGDMDEIYNRIDAIILQWADAEGIVQNSRGPYFDAAHLKVLEEINDRPYISAYTPYDGNPSPYSTGALGVAYALFANEIMERLLVQGPLQSIFANATFNFAEDKLALNDTLSAILGRASANAPTAGTESYTVYWNEIARVINHYHDDLGVTENAAKSAIDSAVGFRTLPIDILGTSGDDIIGSRYGNEVLRGGAGNDTIYASLGEDIHLFGNDSGNDLIGHNPSELNGYDAIRFETLNSSQIQFSKSGQDLIISASGISEVITVQSHYGLNPVGGRSLGNSIREIQFANGEIWDVTTIDNIVEHGIPSPVTLTGTAGADTITATGTTLNMTGGAGADTFVINQSSAKFITITDFDPTNDIVDITAFTGTDNYDLEMGPVDKVGHATFSLFTPTGNITLNFSGLDLYELGPQYFRSDYLHYGHGQTIGGTSGNDNIRATVANDTIYGNEGADSIYGDIGHDAIYGWIGNDTLSGYQGNDTITGDAGADSISGDDDDDALYGGDDADTIRGGYGNDLVGGDAGNDSLFGDNNNDTVDGGIGNDTLNGGEGNDILAGGAGTDVLNGGDGIDTASYEGDSVGVNFDAGTGDTYSSIENFTGSAFADTIVGGSAANYLKGLDGNDVIAGAGGADTLDGGAGYDIVSYLTSTSGVTVNLATNINTGGFAQNNKLFQIEQVSGSNSYSDSLTGSSAAEMLSGNGGNDALTGGDGNDSLWGGDGVDSQEGGNGIDSVYGEAGNDTLRGGADGDTVHGGHDNDLLYGDAGNDTMYGDNLGAPAGTGNDTVYGGDDNDLIYGARFHDSLFGDAGNDTLYGDNSIAIADAGNDTLSGGDGNDLLVGGAGADSMIGGNGIDMALYASSAVGVDVRLLNATQSLGDAAGDSLNGIENIEGSSFADTLHGDNWNNVIIGGLGDDGINGRGGADTLDGGSGFDLVSYGLSASGVVVDLATNINTGGDAAGDQLISIEYIFGSNYQDSITGSSANELLNGSAGDDTIIGGAGNDTLNGGTENDQFYFGTGHGTDTLLDFSAGAATSDIIRFAGLGVSTFSQVLAATVDVGGNAVITTSGGSITLIGVTKAALNANDFQFT